MKPSNLAEHIADWVRLRDSMREKRDYRMLELRDPSALARQLERVIRMYSAKQAHPEQEGPKDAA